MADTLGMLRDVFTPQVIASVGAALAAVLVVRVLVSLAAYYRAKAQTAQTDAARAKAMAMAEFFDALVAAAEAIFPAAKSGEQKKAWVVDQAAKAGQTPTDAEIEAAVTRLKQNTGSGGG